MYVDAYVDDSNFTDNLLSFSDWFVKKISHRKGNRSLAETNEGDPVDWRNVESLVMEILIF